MKLLNKFDEYVEKQPNRLALRSENGSLTFLQIDNLSKQLANRLNTFKANQIVPFYLKDTRFVLPVIVGIWKSGRIPMPLVSALSISESLKRVSEVAWNTIITDFDYQNPDFNTLKIDSLNKDIVPTFVESNTSPQYAYILTTSGSTGVPKKVFLTEQNIAWILTNLYPLIEVNEKTKFLFSTPYSFDVSLTEILSPVLAGAELFCLTTSSSRTESIRMIPQLIKKEQVTHLSLSPSFANALISIAGEHVFDNLHDLMIAGENFPINLAKKLKLAINAGCHVFNLYGPTETTVYASYYQLSGQEEDYVPIGKALNGAVLKIFNNGKEADQGELYIGGNGVTAGYMLDKKLKQEKFITLDDINFYKTGDEVKRLSNGEIVFLERKDNQVQVNGIRVELGEIQAIVNKLADVFSSVIEYYKGRLYIFYQAKANKKAEINRSVPDYLNPIIIKVPEYLYNFNRKIDTKAMIKKYYLQTVSSGHNIVKERLANLLANFNVSQISDLDSLELVRFIIKVEEEFKLNIADQYVNSLTNLDKLADFILHRPEKNIRTKKASQSDLLNLELLFNNYATDYHDSFITASPTQQSLFSQHKHSFDVLNIALDKVDRDEILKINHLLKKLATKIDILRMGWFVKNNRLCFKLAKGSHPLLFISENDLTENDLDKLFYQSPGRPTFLVMINPINNSLKLIFSHHLLDASSAELLTKLFVELDQDKVSITDLPASSYDSFMQYLKEQNQNLDLQKALVNLPETSINLNLSKNSNQLNVIKFPASIEDVDHAYILGLYSISQVVMQERHSESVTGKIAMNIRNFVNFDATNIIGDIHATLPWQVLKTDSLADLEKRYYYWKSLYSTGVDYRYCIFNQIGKDKVLLGKINKKWSKMNLSFNYLGEVKEIDKLIGEIWHLPFKANYVTLLSKKGYLYAILYGNLLQKKKYTISIEDKNLIIQNIKLTNGSTSLN